MAWCVCGLVGKWFVISVGLWVSGSVVGTVGPSEDQLDPGLVSGLASSLVGQSMG